MGNSVKDLFKTSRLGFGGAAISGEGAGYGFGPISDSNAQDLLLRAFDMGVRVYDTAPIYGFGLSEKRIGQAFKSRRENVFIISKSGVTWDRNMRVDMSNDPKVTLQMLEKSLKDLQSDYIDLYMIHWPDKRVDIRKPLEVLARAKDQGKIKHIGLCNTYAEDLLKACEVENIEAIQSQFNLFETGVDTELWNLIQAQDIAVMSWGTLDKGIITGRVDEKRKFEREDCRSWAPWWKAMDKKSRYQKMARIRPLLEKEQVKAVDLAVQYNLKKHQVDMVLCGARNQEQLEGVWKATQVELPQDFLDQVEQELKRA